MTTITLNSASTNVTSVTETILDNLYEASMQASHRYAGLGSYQASWQTFLSGIDRFGVSTVPPNHEVTGLTFITRPKLCLATANLKQDRTMSLLNTVDPYRLEFSIRAYLDMKFARSKLYSPLATNSPFINSESPFIVPLTNSIRNFSGFPDFFIDTETTQGGFYGEDQTIATGSDFNSRSYDFSIEFQDIQSGYIMAMFLYWIRYIALVRRGTMMAYMEDILAQRLNYTCSIYRLILDPSRRSITKWCKATGCFPKSLPIGAAFDIPDRENYIHATQRFSVPFQANTVEYMDPIILQEFNMLVNAWAGDMETAATSGIRTEAPVSSFANFCGIPYIDLGAGANELKFWCLPEELEDPMETILSQIDSELESLKLAVSTLPTTDVSPNSSITSTYADTPSATSTSSVDPFGGSGIAADTTFGSSLL